jgi:hypothetical protein
MLPSAFARFKGVPLERDVSRKWFVHNRFALAPRIYADSLHREIESAMCLPAIWRCFSEGQVALPIIFIGESDKALHPVHPLAVWSRALTESVGE